MLNKKADKPVSQNIINLKNKIMQKSRVCYQLQAPVDPNVRERTDNSGLKGYENV